MGYNVTMRGANFTIPADKLDAACQAMKDLNKRDELKTGGSFTFNPDGTPKRKPCFAWMPEDYDETMHTAAEILMALGFEVSAEEGEDLHLLGYSDKTGSESVFLAALAPFVPAGSFVNWEGEDGELWQDYFDGASVTTKEGSVVYV